MIELRKVTKEYSKGNAALNGISVKIERGEFVFIVGDSGSGKSTLIKLIMKELNPTEGTIIVNGQNLNRMKHRNIAKYRRGIPEQEIGKIFEMYYSGYSDLQHFGLGLSYCRNVVKAHGGYIQIRSSTEPERHGTEFTLCLPRRKRGRRKPNE